MESYSDILLYGNDVNKHVQHLTKFLYMDAAILHTLTVVHFIKYLTLPGELEFEFILFLFVCFLLSFFLLFVLHWFIIYGIIEKCDRSRNCCSKNRGLLLKEIMIEFTGLGVEQQSLTHYIYTTIHVYRHPAKLNSSI